MFSFHQCRFYYIPLCPRSSSSRSLLPVIWQLIALFIHHIAKWSSWGIQSALFASDQLSPLFPGIDSALGHHRLCPRLSPVLVSAQGSAGDWRGFWSRLMWDPGRNENSLISMDASVQGGLGLCPCHMLGMKVSPCPNLPTTAVYVCVCVCVCTHACTPTHMGVSVFMCVGWFGDSLSPDCQVTGPSSQGFTGPYPCALEK